MQTTKRTVPGKSASQHSHLSSFYRPLLDDILFSRHAQQHVDELGHVGDADLVVTVDVGSIKVNARGVLREQVVNECRDVGNAELAIHVDIAFYGRYRGLPALGGLNADEHLVA